MARRFIHLSLLSAWLCASGAMLDVAQLAAWTRMFAGYARSESLAAAARETFDPGKPCAICRAVGKARDAAGTRTPATAAAAERMILISEAPAAFVAQGPARRWPVTGAWRAATRAGDVPVPPPRGSAQLFLA